MTTKDSPDSDQGLQQELARLAQSINGTLGVCVQHLESGRRIEHNAGVPFPMASTFKLPLAVHILSLVDAGQLAGGQMVEVLQSDLCPGSGIIRSLLSQPGVILSVRNLLELALVISDNTAADVLLRLAGGPQAVTAYLRAAGIAEIRLDRYTKYLVADKYGISGLDAREEWSLARYQELLERLSEAQAGEAAARFAEDARDSATPAAMVALLARVCRQDLLAPPSRDALLGAMERCQSGEGALKGMLPPGVTVAHKTGTLAGVVANDMGIITLPGGAGRLAISVSVKSAEAKGEASSASQRAIAHAARAAYDFFLLPAAH